MSAHDDDPIDALTDIPEPAQPVDEDRAREDERIRQLILARRNRFMAAALAGAGVALNGCWDAHSAGSGGAGGAGGQAGAAGDSGAGGGGGSSGLGGVGGPSACLSIEICPDGIRTPPCVCLEAPFDAGVEDEDSGLPPSVCLTPID